jgi:hypothetical protein
MIHDAGYLITLQYNHYLSNWKNKLIVTVQICKDSIYTVTSFVLKLLSLENKSSSWTRIIVLMTQLKKQSISSKGHCCTCMCIQKELTCKWNKAGWQMHDRESCQTPNWVMNHNNNWFREKLEKAGY